MVGVMKQKMVPSRLSAMAPKRFDQWDVVPLVHQHQVCTCKLPIEVERVEVVLRAPKGRVGALEPCNGFVTVLANQVLAAPGVRRLEHLDTVATRQKLSDHSAEKMRIPVIPVGHERVVKHHDAHARSCRTAALRVRISA